jgi:hypothetical protein
VRIVLCFLFIIFYSILDVCLAQPDTLWTQRISSNPAMNLYGATALSDGGFAVAGVCTRNASQDLTLTRLSAQGAVLWSQAFGDASQNEQANAVVELPDHSFMLIGQSAPSSGSSRTLLVMGISAVGDSLWTHNYTVSSGLRKGVDAVALADGNVAAVGYALGRDGAHSDLWLIKLTATGDTLWTRLFGGNDTDTGSKIMEQSDGSLILAGQTRSYGQGDWDLWTIWTSSSGDSLSSQTFGTSGIEKSFGLASGYGRIFVGGRTQGTGENCDAYLVAKSDITSPVLWTQTYDAGMNEEQISGVAARPGGGAVCVGWSGVSTATARPWLFRVNDEGTLEQSWVDGSVQQGQFNGVIPVANGGYFAWGTITENLSVKGYAVRYAPTGELAGTVRESATGHVVAGANVGLSDGSEYAVTNARGQYSLGLRPGTHDLAAWGPCVSRQSVANVLVTLDSTTHTDFQIGTPGYECDQSSINLVAQNHRTATASLRVENTGDGDLELRVTVEPLTPGDWLSVDPQQTTVAPGDHVDLSVSVHADTADNGLYDYFGYVTLHTFVCPDSVETIPVFATVLDVSEHGGALPLSFALEPAFPNPFNPTTTIGYSIPRDALVSMTVYDVTGRKVATLLNQMQSAGVHRVTFDASALASGVYWLRMQAGDLSARQKLILLK